MSSSGGFRRQSRVTLEVKETKPVVTEKGASVIEVRETTRRALCRSRWRNPTKVNTYFFFLSYNTKVDISF